MDRNPGMMLFIGKDGLIEFGALHVET